MARGMSLVIEGDEHERMRTVRFGKLMNSPWADNGMWFVSLRQRRNNSDWTSGSRVHTYVVSDEIAQPHTIKRIGLDYKEWERLAAVTWIGDWCEQYEVLWKDIPYFVHIFPTGEKVRYGMSCTPDPRQEGQYLWYVVVANGSDDPLFKDFGMKTVIVDDVCTKPDFMNYIGFDRERWVHICWECPANDEDPRTTMWSVDLAPDIYFNHEYDKKFRTHSWWEKVISSIFRS